MKWKSCMKKITIVFFALLVVPVSVLSAAGAQEAAEPTETRGVWVWGTQAWGGVYEGAMLDDVNEWLNDRFGITIAKISPIPQGSTPGQALNLIIAQGKLPDLFGNFGGAEAVNYMADLAENGQIMPLTKYFEDPANYPILAEADRAYLRSYMYDGEIYSFPGYGWPRDGKSASYGQAWAIRVDVLEKYGEPTTMQEVLEVARKIKQDGITDANGQTGYPFAIHTYPENQGGSAVGGILSSTFGSGWKVDAKKRRVPTWASEEYKTALQWVNTMWREGLMSPGQWVNDQETLGEHYNVSRYGIVYGPSWVNAQFQNTLRSLIDEGKETADSPSYQARLPYRMVNLATPNTDNPGPIYPGTAPYGFLSADAPNPDGIMQLLEWYHSDEGCISSHFNAGLLGIDWEWVEGEEYIWQTIGEAPGTQERGGDHETGAWADAAKCRENPPRLPPVVHYLSTPSYQMFYGLAWYNYQDTINEEKYGYRFWDQDYIDEMADRTQPVPSYSQVVVETPPQEKAAFNTVQQRIREGVVEVAQAASAQEFESKYQRFVETLIAVTNWKPIHEAEQQRWLAWMEENGIDDRARLGSSTPIPEWRDVMGW